MNVHSLSNPPLEIRWASLVSHCEKSSFDDPSEHRIVGCGGATLAAYPDDGGFDPLPCEVAAVYLTIWYPILLPQRGATQPA